MRVIVVGLGTAGAAVAALAARRGLTVIGLEAGPLDEAGARWTNGVPAWSFDEVGLERPSPPELRAGSVPFHLKAGWSDTGVTVRSALEVDMVHLGRRLRAAATGAGATLRGGVKVTALRPGGVDTTEGAVDGDVVVDASGYAGARLAGQPHVDRTDLCAAAQYVHHVVDPQAAERFFRERGAAPGEVVCFSGVAGGYSILNVRLDGREVGLLTGTIPALGHAGGKALLDRFVSEQPWIGAPVSGGSRAIPLRRAWEVVGRGSLALVGDAACQVFAAHGSGITQELLAAKLLAEVLACGGTCWDYNVAWQRAHGGLLASSDLFRRFSQDLSAARIGLLMQRGILSPPLMADTMDQRPLRPPMGAILGAAGGLARLPRLARNLLPTLARMKLVERHYRAYPTEPSALPGWVDALERIDPRAPRHPWVTPSPGSP